jgi:Ca2+-binding RTX toxin-like protein
VHQTTNIAVHGTDSDGDSSATQAVALTFNANTTLTGTSGEDALAGGSANDLLNGGAGADLLIGGKGSDTLTGGTGADVFKWGLADQGTNAAKAADTVMDFDNSPTGDKLDLRDLLAGEHSDQGNLANFLHFSVTAGSTKIEISTSGGFAGGTYNAAAVDQTSRCQAWT